MAQLIDGWVLGSGMHSGEETWYFASCVLAPTGWGILSVVWDMASSDCSDGVDC